MKNKNFSSKKIRRTVTWMLAMIMSLSTVTGSMTVYANNNEIDNYMEDLDLSKENADDSEDEGDTVATQEAGQSAVVEINEEEEPLAAGIQGGGALMLWWWLLIIILAGITGYMMYKSQESIEKM